MDYLSRQIRQFLKELGPASPPPPPVVRALLAVVWKVHPALAAGFDPNEERHRYRLFEIVVAYGCGYLQVPLLGLAKWGECWPKARAALYKMVEHWVRRTARWLEVGAGVSGFDLARRAAPDERTAHAITCLLIDGGCGCSNWGAGGFSSESPTPPQFNSHNAQLRFDRCFREHRLLAWQPAEMDLMAYIARAVKGSVARSAGRQREFAVGALVQGLYYYLCSQETGLRAVDILIWECFWDGQRNFYGLNCRECQRRKGEWTSASRLTPFTSTRWLILPSALGGGFQPQRRWKCPACEHLYPASLESCPFDHTRPKRGDKPGIVWIPASFGNIELDAPVDDDAGPSEAALMTDQASNSEYMAKLIDAKALFSTLPEKRRDELAILLAARL